MTGLGRDLQHSLRMLWKSPAFSTVAILSLAIGIGANAAIFSAMRFALLDPLPVASPDELRVVYWTTPTGLDVSQNYSSGSTDRTTGLASRSNASYPMFKTVERASAGVADLFGFNFAPGLSVSIDDQPAVAAGGLMVSGSYFPSLRPPMALGRAIGPADETPAAPPVTVISHGFWRRAFGSDPDVLGRTVRINGTPFQIIGVTGPGFRGLSTGSRLTPLTDVTVPLTTEPVIWSFGPASFLPLTDRLWVRMMARVPPGQDDRARDVLTTAFRQSSVETGLLSPDRLDKVNATLLPGARGLETLSARAERPLLILAGVVAAVLLIACVNLAGLILARGVARQQELAIRRALGAGRARLMAQLLSESAVLGVLGGLVGLLLAAWTRPIIGAMITTGLGADAADLPFDWRVVGLTAAVSGVAALLCGLLPAARLTGRDMVSNLRERATLGGAPRLTLGRVLLALQIAISVPLVVGAGLLIGTLGNLGRVDLGFDASNLLMFRLEPAHDPTLSTALAARTPGDAVDQFADRLIRELEAIPGVSSATFVENALLSGWVSNNSAVINGARRTIYMNGVGPRYFETMRIPIVAGRTLEATDAEAGQRGVVINETAARQFFGQAQPVGAEFRYGRSDAVVVGIAADGKYSSLRQDVPPTLYDPMRRRTGISSMNVVVRTLVPPSTLEAPIRDAVARVDANLPPTEFRTQQDQIDQSLGRERLMAKLSVVFGLFALVLACIGLYGVTAYSVGRRTNEIGIRLALGARRPQVLWLILKQVIVLAAVGLAIGIPAALLTGPLLESLLFNITPSDPATIGLAAAVMLAVSLAAGLVPAVRAARLEALAALREG
jgi:predicted permease